MRLARSDHEREPPGPDLRVLLHQRHTPDMSLDAPTLGKPPGKNGASCRAGAVTAPIDGPATAARTTAIPESVPDPRSCGGGCHEEHVTEVEGGAP